MYQSMHGNSSNDISLHRTDTKAFYLLLLHKVNIFNKMIKYIALRKNVNLSDFLSIKQHILGGKHANLQAEI